MTKTCMIFVACLMALCASLAQAAQAAATIGGDYICHGESEGKSYTLPLTVHSLGEDTYRLEWNSKHPATGELVPMYIGLAIKTGDGLAVLIVSPERTLAVSFYRVQGTALIGEWTPGDGQRYVEDCRRPTSA